MYLHRITVTVLTAFGYYIYLNNVDYQRSVINTYLYWTRHTDCLFLAYFDTNTKRLFKRVLFLTISLLNSFCFYKVKQVKWQIKYLCIDRNKVMMPIWNKDRLTPDTHVSSAFTGIHR